jgi:hypothetical protein
MARKQTRRRPFDAAEQAAIDAAIAEGRLVRAENGNWPERWRGGRDEIRDARAAVGAEHQVPDVKCKAGQGAAQKSSPSKLSVFLDQVFYRPNREHHKGVFTTLFRPKAVLIIKLESLIVRDLSAKPKIGTFRDTE